MALWSKIRGTIETLFQLGLGGPQIKNNSGSVDVRNSGDTGYVNLRVAPPVGDNDAATKQYVDTISRPSVVSVQFNGSNALPNNSSTEQYYIVTTSGANATIGQILWDDGNNSGTVTVLTAVEGRSVFTSQAFNGGTVTLLANSYYVWDTGSSSWLLEANPQIAGAIREVRMPITNAASQSSATQIPANAYIQSVLLNITTPYSAGATISVGQTGSAALLMGTGDNLATVAGRYSIDEEDIAWGASALSVLVTVSGAPSAGAGDVVVEYTVPNN